MAETKSKPIRMAALSKMRFRDEYKGKPIVVEGMKDAIGSTGRWKRSAQKKPPDNAIFTVSGPGAQEFSQALVNNGQAIIL